MAIDMAVWGPPLAVVVAGAVIGIATVARMRSNPSDTTITDESRRNDLGATRDEVLEALKVLELDRDKLAPGEYEREREILLARGGKALAALEDPAAPAFRPTRAPSPELPAAAAPAQGLAPEWKGALYALAAVALIAVLWQFATSNSVDRREGASMTGNQSLGGAPDAGEDPGADVRKSEFFQQKVAEYEAKLAANPNDLEAANAMTHLYLMSGDPSKAMTYNQTVLEADPKNNDGRTYRAVLAAMMSMPDKALEQLDAVLADDPTHTRATVYKAMVLFQSGREAEAATFLEAAAAARPNDPELQNAMAQMRQAQAAGPGPGSAPPPAGAAGGDRIVAGTVSIDPAAQAAVPDGATLFVSVSDPNRPGPPVAADKITGPLTFPRAFELTTAQIRAMPGTSGSVPPVFDVKVRIDLDGNAMTREPGAPSATMTGVSAGASGLALTLTVAGAPVPAPPGGGAGAAAGGDAGLLAPISPPTGAPPSGASAGGDLLAAGVAELDPARGPLTGSEIVFVSVKDPAGGPPIASARMPAKFPLAFRITTADVIQMGGNRPIPDAFVVSVRVDADGNATTKSGEPEAVLQSVRRGAEQLKLTLR
ncbi:MAG: tetratricopeptide repeat protein [Myxococcota bacterium]